MRASVKKERTILSNLVAAAALLSLLLFSMGLLVVLRYRSEVARDLRLLTSQTEIATVIEELGPPAEVFREGQRIEGRGWRTPSRPMSHEVMVFIRRTGMKYYVFVDTNGVIEYVFSSGS
jgi:hypothetical protein